MYEPIFHDKNYVYSEEGKNYLRGRKFKKKLEFFSHRPSWSYIINNRGKDDRFFILDISREPQSFRVPNSAVIKNQRHIDLILTWDEEILQTCQNAIHLNYGTTWLTGDAINRILINKRNSISFICGGKKITDGHIKRHQLWVQQKKINNYKEFFNSSQNPVANVDNNKFLPKDMSGKYAAFFSKFHIAIENQISKNYFSEKLIDSLISKTVPIYVGCGNVGDFFDIRGMICLNTVDEIIGFCNDLDIDNKYKELQEFIDINYCKALEYKKDIIIRVFEKIKDKIE